MTSVKRYLACAALTGLGFASGAYAQVSSINSASVQTHVFNDVPGATAAVLNKYPTGISLTEIGVSQASGFADRDVWKFSSDGGSTAYQFHHNDYFSASLDLTLTGNPATPRKEAGFLLSSTSSGDIQFIVNTDGHEVVQFGGIGFYSFNANNGITYNEGDRITLGITYFQEENGKNALMFTANGVNSPIQEFASGGIGDGSTLGGYFQIVNDPNNPLNAGTATFGNIRIVPEPSSLALLGLGLLPFLFAYRRRN